jgi:hypothetical protein
MKQTKKNDIIQIYVNMCSKLEDVNMFRKILL